MALEIAGQFLGSAFPGGDSFRFAVLPDKRRTKDIPIAKLHGSADTDEIIPPTWNKGIDRKMVEVWSGAHDILRSANQIRIVGYSLPVADAYIKYLLKSAAIDAPHLKQIDVLCRDSDGQTWARYRDFIKFDYARFATADVSEYFSTIKATTVSGVSINQPSLSCNRLEAAHEKFFNSHGYNLSTGPPRDEALIV